MTTLSTKKVLISGAAGCTPLLLRKEVTDVNQSKIARGRVHLPVSGHSSAPVSRGWELLLIGLFAWRAVLEERTLRDELQGYAAYMTQVKYRLVPYVW